MSEWQGDKEQVEAPGEEGDSDPLSQAGFLPEAAPLGTREALSIHKDWALLWTVVWDWIFKLLNWFCG